MAKVMPKHAWMLYEEREHFVKLDLLPQGGEYTTTPWFTHQVFKAHFKHKYRFMNATAKTVGDRIIAGWNEDGVEGDKARDVDGGVMKLSWSALGWTLACASHSA